MLTAKLKFLDAFFNEGLTLQIYSIYYLGVKLPSDLKRLFEFNYANFHGIFQNLLNGWKSHTFNLLGHMAILKMMLLPRFLCLIQNIPIKLSVVYLSRLKGIISKYWYLWFYKHPQILYKILVDQGQRWVFTPKELTAYYKYAHTIKKYY